MSLAGKVKPFFDPYVEAPVQVWENFSRYLNAVTSDKHEVIKASSTSERLLLLVLEGSAYNQKNHAFVNQRSISKTYLDLALGYHFNQARIVSALAYHHIPFKEKGMDSSRTQSKTPCSLKRVTICWITMGLHPILASTLGLTRFWSKKMRLWWPRSPK